MRWRNKHSICLFIYFIPKVHRSLIWRGRIHEWLQQSLMAQQSPNGCKSTTWKLTPPKKRETTDLTSVTSGFWRPLRDTDASTQRNSSAQFVNSSKACCCKPLQDRTPGNLSSVSVRIPGGDTWELFFLCCRKKGLTLIRFVETSSVFKGFFLRSWLWKRASWLCFPGRLFFFSHIIRTSEEVEPKSDKMAPRSLSNK